ncbi:hypothetical protein DPMN_011937 [Dreissena polymorpha]|uniref:Uncharacterized protein n=1 Tax=Dreissena polymorpha TaxID=45954 RepID=A0A9D4N2J0_DREPO|nr:hypothetical protein DPMN_011937 [Dreissena polymorpha]
MLGLAITRHSLLSSVPGKRSYQSGDKDSDHALVCSRMGFLSSKLHRSEPPVRPHINKARNEDCRRREDIVTSLENVLKYLHERDVIGHHIQRLPCRPLKEGGTYFLSCDKSQELTASALGH